MSNFDANAILRGAELTVVGAYRALQNPALFKSNHYRQAAVACCAGIAIHLLLLLPVVVIRVVLFLPSLLFKFDIPWDRFNEGFKFFSNTVLQVPFLLMTIMSHITPTLDDLFMESIRWVDKTNTDKHKNDVKAQVASWYPPLRQLTNARLDASSPESTKHPNAVISRLHTFFRRMAKRTGFSVAFYVASQLPYIGPFVYPVASFATFNKAVGPAPAAGIFLLGLVLPKRILIVFFQSFFSSRSLMRVLLQPYFARIPFTRSQKSRWFFEREGVLFGFALGFYFILQIPFVGVLMYGIAEASTAYLLTKITEPPPALPDISPDNDLPNAGPAKAGELGSLQGELATQTAQATMAEYAEHQTVWRNKKEFLTLPVDKMDAVATTVRNSKEGQKLEMHARDIGSMARELKGKKFT